MNKYAEHILNNYPLMKEAAMNAAKESKKKNDPWSKIPKRKGPSVNGEQFDNSVDSVLNEKSSMANNRYYNYLQQKYAGFKSVATKNSGKDSKKDVWKKLEKKKPSVNGEQFDNSVDSVLNEKSSMANDFLSLLEQDLTMKVAAIKAKNMGFGKKEKGDNLLNKAKAKDQLNRGNKFKSM